MNSHAYQEYYARNLPRCAEFEDYKLEQERAVMARERALRGHKLAQERSLYYFYYLRARREVEAAHSPDLCQVVPPLLLCVPRLLYAPSPRFHAVEEPAEDAS